MRARCLSVCDYPYVSRSRSKPGAMFSFPLWSLHLTLQLLVAFNTTRFPFFAECPRHSAKTILHSAKDLPSAALGKNHSAKLQSAKPALPSVFYRTLGKGLAECPKRTRQKKGNVTAGLPSAVDGRHTAKTPNLPCGVWEAHDKVSIFAVCESDRVL